MKYTTSFRNSVLKKILPPSNRSVTSVSKETGVAVVTINNWLAKLKEGKMSLGEDDENPSSMRNSREKLDLLIEYQTVSEENQGEWLRQHGLHSEHLPLFRQELNELMAEKVDEKDKRIKELEKQLKETQKELNRKTDALAELAAIYTLKKSLPRTMGLWTRKNDECRGQTGYSRFHRFLCCPRNCTAENTLQISWNLSQNNSALAKKRNC